MESAPLLKAASSKEAKDPVKSLMELQEILLKNM